MIVSPGKAMARIISLGRSRRYRRPSGWRAALVLRLARHDLGRSRRELAADLGRLFAPMTEGTIEAWEAARPPRMLPVARWFVHSIDDLIRDASLPTHRALLSVAAQFEQFMGWLWVDIGDYEQARRSYDGAIVRAVESGNRALAGYLLACK